MSHRTAKRQRFYAARRRWRAPWAKLGYRITATNPKEQELADIMGRALADRDEFCGMPQTAAIAQAFCDSAVHGTGWMDAEGRRIAPSEWRHDPPTG